MNSNENTYTNELIHESSPYLLQHAHNPVNWLPWGEKALQKAKDENKLIIVSIGYAACHWCHVMEHESFEDTNVAEVMNENFVCIKVDREERPDIDQIYMDACQLIQNSGGWPLNAFALPDGRPIYAGTYYPKDNWLSVMKQINDYYRKNPTESEKRAASITQGINNMEGIVKVQKSEDDYKDLEGVIWKNWKHGIDHKWGGRNGSPKFPMPVGWEYLLQYYHHSGNNDALESVKTTLDKMAFGGIYDQIGGGFARYSVDAQWKAPHFEKMLYDNGQLLSLYANAYKLTQNKRYKDVLMETIEFVKRELMHKNGGFFSSLDADSEGVEGKFYVWSEDEFRKTLDSEDEKDVTLLIDYYNIKSKGNWDGHNILWLDGATPQEFIEKNNLDYVSWNNTLARANNKLLSERAKRIRPGLDDKILTSWNALMLSGLCDAYEATQDADILELAKKNAKFISSNLLNDSSLYRNYKYSNKKGKASITGFLDDYALYAEALIKLYQVTFEEEHLMQAKNLTSYTLDYFFDDATGMFYYTPSNGEKLIARKYEISDNVIPSSNSVMAKNLFVLGDFFEIQKWKEISKQMLDNTLDNTVKHGAYYANWGQLLLLHNKPVYEIAIVGKNYREVLNEMQKHYLPNALYLGAEMDGNLPLLKFKYQEGQTTIYVCSGGICKEPTTDVNKALKMIK